MPELWEIRYEVFFLHFALSRWSLKLCGNYVLFQQISPHEANFCFHISGADDITSHTIWKYMDNRSRVFPIIAALKNFTKLTGNQQQIYFKVTRYICFALNFVIFQSSSFTEHLQSTTFESNPEKNNLNSKKQIS